MSSWLELTASTSVSSSLNSLTSHLDNENNDLEIEEIKKDNQATNLRRPISTGNSRRMEKLIVKTNKCQQQYLETRCKTNNKSLGEVSNELMKKKKISRNESGLESDASARLNSSNEDQVCKQYSNLIVSSTEQNIDKTIDKNVLEELQRQIFQGKRNLQILLFKKQ